ncbi:MAG: nucleotidyltransferase domain-containing protein [Methanosphaera sp.]|uniref:nucleotidyltransferase domain-containing protein n=1 Tax=Methanosphaera sp. ISO3-F5 TaxID=1452353 RepID=UPI002B25F8C3|nr:nucleotidyltransferase domain-containing protein [Methanosphaera sp. ISO3-F5]MBR0472553.1 nucleotidyltransferase domain-containing protein [Methanosphaera sp.]WQH64248.1 nucleotidyltransferase domain-containing protein [Methanosphaera sp. ISO3-F5]
MKNRRLIAQKFANSIKSQYIDKIILYGSVARGDDTENSDIDILIITNNYDKIESKVYNESYTIIIDDNEIISPHFITPEHFEKIKNFSFISTVLKEGILLG